MACTITTSNKFDKDIDKLILFYKRKHIPERSILRITTDIYNTLVFIRKALRPDNLASSIKDYDYPEYRFFITDKYGYKIFVKAYPDQNMIKAVCLVGKQQQFKPKMFIEKQISKEQLRQAFAEFGCDYDEATREYLAEQARLASMSEIDKEIELFKV